MKAVPLRSGAEDKVSVPDRRRSTRRRRASARAEVYPRSPRPARGQWRYAVAGDIVTVETRLKGHRLVLLEGSLEDVANDLLSIRNDLITKAGARLLSRTKRDAVAEFEHILGWRQQLPTEHRFTNGPPC